MISGANEEELELAGARMDIMLATNYTTKNPGPLAIIDKYHDKEIERLNNIIDLVVKDMEMTKYNPELPTYNSCVAVDKDHIQQWIDKLKELKEGEKNVEN